ncbi:GntR family transcriptional regulator [Plantibacter sp. Mn2098]|uniref:GntR family transcriptional regulator n=1 Tax=Plantibacter sp. Mn2098 TaxID=3395266 RepID=UPI003BCA2F57
MRVSDRAYRSLREEILEGILRPGMVLAEVEQSTRLGISRTPLREALSRLSADGLVGSTPGRGLVVTEVSTDRIDDLFRVRRALEEQAARLAAQHGDPARFTAIAAEFADAGTLLEQGDEAKRAYYDLVARFDAEIAAAADNPYLTQALGNLRTHLDRVRRLSKDRPDRLLAAAAEHRLIAEAIAAGDEELAAHATHVHLHLSLRSIHAARAAKGTP